MQAAGGINNQYIALIVTGVFDGFTGSFDRVLSSFFEYGDVYLLTDDLQLFDGGRTINITCRQHGLFALLG